MAADLMAASASDGACPASSRRAGCPRDEAPARWSSVWEASDPDGRRVTLDSIRWEHILSKHPYLGDGPERIMQVVATPDERVAGRRPKEEWFYARGAEPTAWIKVVVHYEGDRDRHHGLPA